MQNSCKFIELIIMHIFVVVGEGVTLVVFALKKCYQDLVTWKKIDQRNINILVHTITKSKHLAVCMMLWICNMRQYVFLLINVHILNSQVLELCANQISDISALCVRPPPLIHLGLGSNKISFTGDYLTGDYWYANTCTRNKIVILKISFDCS